MKELLIYALEVLVCSAALLLAYSVLLERRTAFLHCRLYLIGAMLLAALIPALSIPVWTGETLYMAADPVAAAAPTAAPAATDAGTPSLPVAVTLFLYALGVLLSFGAMIAQIVRIRRLRHGARTIRRADCDIVLTQADISSFSFFRTVYLHDAIPESDMAAVVAHELSHIRHRHSAERIVMECVKALLWWNPFVRIAARRLAEVEEYEADRDVLTQGYDPSEYIATIFKTQFGYSPDIANGLRDSLTKKRFQMMTKHSGDSRALLRLAGSIPVVLLLLACFSFTSQATEIRTDPPNGQSGLPTSRSCRSGLSVKLRIPKNVTAKRMAKRTSISSPKRCPAFSKARERCKISSIGSTPSASTNTTAAVKLSSRSSSKKTAPSPRYRFSILPIPLWAKPPHASSHRHRHGRPARSTGNRSACVYTLPRPVRQDRSPNDRTTSFRWTLPIDRSKGAGIHRRQRGETRHVEDDETRLNRKHLSIPKTPRPSSDTANVAKTESYLIEVKQ